MSYLVKREAYCVNGGIRLRWKLRRDKLGLFGFVFSGVGEWRIAVNLFGIRGCGGFGVLGIGFVLHNYAIATKTPRHEG